MLAKAANNLLWSNPTSLMTARSTSRMLQTRSLLVGGLTTARCFSTIEPKVFSNAVFMPELYPARLTIPTGKSGISYDFTCDNNTTVGEFRQSVLDNTEEDVTSFELLTMEGNNTEELD